MVRDMRRRASRPGRRASPGRGPGGQPPDGAAAGGGARRRDRSAPCPVVSTASTPSSTSRSGDSTVHGVGATSPDRSYVGQLYQRLRSVCPRARLVNLGEGGATAADVRASQLARALALRPNVVTVSVGPNDITRRRSPQQYEEDIEVILAALSRQTGTIVVVNLIPDITVTPRFRHHDARPRCGSGWKLQRGAGAAGSVKRSRRRRPVRPESTGSAPRARPDLLRQLPSVRPGIRPLG